MPIKDLKNTTWLLNDTISVPPLVDSDSLYVSSNGVEGSLGVYDTIPSMEKILNIGNVTIYNFTSNTWADEKYKLCTVTGGNLTANAEMISWFQTNGKFNTTVEEVVANMRKSREVSDALLSSANAKTGKTDANLTDAVNTLLEGYEQGGGGGIIEVDQLPEVGEVGKVYKCQGKYYEWFHGFTNVLVYFVNQFIPLSLLFEMFVGTVVKAHTILTKTTDGILPSTSAEINMYYIEDEDDVFVYGDGAWRSLGEGGGYGTYGGIVNDISEATDQTHYYVFFQSYWIMYPAVSGTIDITNNGEHDVTHYEKANVDLPTKAVFGKRRFPYDKETHNRLLYNGNEFTRYVNFSIRNGDEEIKLKGFVVYTDSENVVRQLDYIREDGAYLGPYWISGDEGWWASDYYREIDFGETPQPIHEDLFNFLKIDTVPIYDIINEISTESEMTALLETAEVGAIYKYTGKTTDTYENGALYVVEEEAANLISFTIDGDSFQAEDGMTWNEFIASEYNTDDAVSATGSCVGYSEQYVVSQDFTQAKLTDVIISGYEYLIEN